MDARRSSERPRSIEARKGWSPSDRKDGGGIETSSGCHPVAGIRVASGARMLAAAGWYGSDMLCVHTVRATRSTGCHRLVRNGLSNYLYQAYRRGWLGPSINQGRTAEPKRTCAAL